MYFRLTSIFVRFCSCCVLAACAPVLETPALEIPALAIQRIYDGPSVSREQISVIHQYHGSVLLISIDGNWVPSSYGGTLNDYELLPGIHNLTFSFDDGDFRSRDACTFRFNAKAGREYWLVANRREAPVGFTDFEWDAWLREEPPISPPQVGDFSGLAYSSIARCTINGGMEYARADAE